MSVFSVLIYFIVAWSVNVAAATNYVPHSGNHSGLWRAATNFVPVLLSSHNMALIGSSTP
jgi:hypothetical protein